MPRRSRYDDDEERLPEGMTRVGYDADTGVYTFQDADGSYWESAPGSRYGQLTRVGHELAGEDDDAQPFLPGNTHASPQVSWRHELMPLLNFGVIIGVALLLLWWYLHVAAGSDGGSALKCPLDIDLFKAVEHAELKEMSKKPYGICSVNRYEIQWNKEAMRKNKVKFYELAQPLYLQNEK